MNKPEVEVGGEYYDGRRLIKCCTHLRCKSLYYTDIERPGLLHESDAMTYWCNHTLESIGQDNGDCDPFECQNNRTCFER